MTAPECRKTLPGAGKPCIARLADGWILTGDLCSTCTQAFMTALDSISGPLKWHHEYKARAAMD